MFLASVGWVLKRLCENFQTIFSYVSSLPASTTTKTVSTNGKCRLEKRTPETVCPAADKSTTCITAGAN